METGKPAFLSELEFRDIQGSRWELLSPLTYRAADGWTLTVPAGFRTDLASIPRGLWNLFPKTGEYNRAAVVHDWLYALGGRVVVRNPAGEIVERRYTKAQADALFYEGMGALGVSWWTRWPMYQAVKRFGRGKF